MNFPHRLGADIQAVSSHIANESLLVKFLSENHGAGRGVAQAGAGGLLESGGGKRRTGIPLRLRLFNPDNLPFAAFSYLQDSFHLFLFTRPLLTG